MENMMTVEESARTYEAVVTNVGNELMMQAVAKGEKVSITQFAVGDGKGDYYRPDVTMTALKNEVWRGDINSCEISHESGNILIVSAICPGSAGGFTIREMGVFDKNNNLIAVCNCPATPKVEITDGVVNEMRLELEIALINGNTVELVIDPNIVTASKKDIEDLKEILKAHGKVSIGTTQTPMEKNEMRFTVEEMPYEEQESAE